MTVTTHLPELNCDYIIDLAKNATGHIITVDTESGETRGMLGISVAFRHQFGLISEYLPVRHLDSNMIEEQLQGLYAVFAESTLVFHNAGYDLWVLKENGYDHKGPFYDTMLMAHWINENRLDYSLNGVSKAYGGEPKNRPGEMQFIIDNAGWDSVPLSLMRIYSAQDSLITHELFEKLIVEFRAQGFDGPLWHEYECKFIRIMHKMSKDGIRVDLEFCIKEILRGEAVMRECIKELGLDPGKRTHLEKLLLVDLGLPVKERTPKGAVSFSKKAMEQYDELLEARDSPVAKIVLRYRGWQKTLGANYRSYMKHVDDDGILHPNFKLHGTRTGRLSCADPALQQIPRDSEKEWNGNLKQAFIPRAGFGLWSIDYGQLEFRLAAAYAEEEQLIDIFKSSDRSLFREMASDLGWEYNKTKTFNYSTMYGGGANNTSRIFGVSLIEARGLIDDYYRQYPKLKRIMQRATNVVLSRGYAQYWTGRRRHFVNKKREAHKAFNAIVQGGGFEIVKRAMIKLDEQVCDENCLMVLQVHDEVVFEIREGMEDYYLLRAKELMEEVDYDFGVPFTVSIARWGEK